MIRWRTSDPKAIRAIRDRFGIPDYTTLNGFSPVLLQPRDKEVFEETARRGFFTVLERKWRKNGGTYSF